MALGDIETAQRYLEQAKLKIIDVLKNENPNNVLSQPDHKPDNDVNKGEVQ